MEKRNLYIADLIERGISMNNKLLIVGVVATTALLAGCSNNADLHRDITALTNQVNELSAKTEELAAEYKMIKSSTQDAAATAQSAAATAQAASANAQAAVSEAERANSRIDNIAESYKK